MTARPTISHQLVAFLWWIAVVFTLVGLVHQPEDPSPTPIAELTELQQLVQTEQVVHVPEHPVHPHGSYHEQLAREAFELLDASEDDAESEVAPEAPVWGLLARQRVHALAVTPHPKTLQRFDWPPVQVLETRLELAFAARGPPHC